MNVIVPSPVTVVTVNTGVRGPRGASGEVTTADNVNTRGAGVYVGKDGSELQFAGIAAATGGLVSVEYDSVTKAIVINVNVYYGETENPPDDLPEGSHYFQIL